MNGKEADIRTTSLQGQHKKEYPLSKNAEPDAYGHCSSFSDTTKSSSRSNPFPLTAAQSEFEVNMENNTLTEVNGRGVRLSFVSRSSHISGNIDVEYQEAATEYQIRWIAKRIAIRDSALLTLASLCIYLVFGVLFYSFWEGEWSYEQSLLFLIYTMTTVGYGNHRVPTSPQSKIFTSFYVIIGIGLLAVCASEFYAYFELKGVQAKYFRDPIVRKGRARSNKFNSKQYTAIEAFFNNQNVVDKWNVFGSLIDFIIDKWRQMKHFTRYTLFGMILASSVPLILIIASGAIIVGQLEGWNTVDSFYFGVVSSTTVGYGDMYPERKASIWVCIFWLPFSFLFLSIFLSNINRDYTTLCGRYANQIEKRLRKKNQKDLEKGLPKDASILEQVATIVDLPSDLSLRANFAKARLSFSEILHQGTSDLPQSSMTQEEAQEHDPIQEEEDYSDKEKAVLILVQERIALIIQHEILLKQNSLKATSQRKQYDDLNLRFPKMKEVTEKWLIPLPVRQSFAAVTVDILVEFGLEGLRHNKLFSLTPESFQRLLMPVTATMEKSVLDIWLTDTETIMVKSDWYDTHRCSMTSNDECVLDEITL